MPLHLQCNKNLFYVFALVSAKDRKRLFQNIDCNFISCCRDSYKNILDCNINLQAQNYRPKEKQKLRWYKTDIRQLRRAKIGIKESQKILQKGKFSSPYTHFEQTTQPYCIQDFQLLAWIDLVNKISLAGKKQ